LLLNTRQLYGTKKWVRFPIAFVIIGGIGALIMFSSVDDTPPEPGQQKSYFEQTLTWELRTKVWKCVAHIHSEQGLIVSGFGYDETKNKLVACYEQQIKETNKKEQFITSRYNTHNQFVDIYFNWGIVALALFLLFLGVVFIKNRKQFMPTAFLIVLVSYCMVENVFHRQIGSYYLGFVLIVMLIRNQLSENKAEKEVE
ncbi:MAG: O-antigen ligase family protein, partial [Bacteroidota bacterium]